MSLLRGYGRGRAFVRFVFAGAWVIGAYFLARIAAHGFTRGPVFPLIRNAFEIFLLILGFSYMEMAWDGEREPVRAMGLKSRSGAAREFGIGIALGWGMVAVVLLVIVLAGTFYVRTSTSARAWEMLVLQFFVLATGTLAAELAFRGYPFQKLTQATGPIAATALAAIFFGLMRQEIPGSSAAAMWVAAVAAVILSVAYLRTRALWLCWGIHFAWLASVAILFGQPLAGDRRASSVIQSYVDGPTWLTGSEYGPEASLVSLAVLWIGLYFLFWATGGAARNLSGAGTRSAALAVEMAAPRRPFSDVIAPGAIIVESDTKPNVVPIDSAPQAGPEMHSRRAESAENE